MAWDMLTDAYALSFGNICPSGHVTGAGRRPVVTGRCVTAKTSEKREVKDERKRVISPHLLSTSLRDK
jgi:hypothetical protein